MNDLPALLTGLPFGDPQLWVSLLTLTLLEIVLGIDNLVFLSILAGRLPARQQARARLVGLAFALGLRLALLVAIGWIMRMTQPLVSLLGHALSWRDLILICGGLFLIYKGTREIHARLEGGHGDNAGGAGPAGFVATIVQIALLDVVFSLDSMITAVGMSRYLAVMMAAVVVAVLVMGIASGPVSRYIEQRPTVKMLALSFLLLIGMTLVADGVGAEVPRGTIYAAIGFSLAVEALNQIASRRRTGSRPGRTGAVRPATPLSVR